MNWTQQQDFMRSMPAMAAKILIMMLWTNRSLTGDEWAKAVDASDKTVKASLDWLAERGLAQDNGRLSGWSLPSQLPLPFKQLWQGHSGVYLEESFAIDTFAKNDTVSNDTDSRVNAPADGSAGKEIGNSELCPPLINCLINNSDPDQELIKQPINQIGEIENSELQRVMAMTDPPIIPPTADELAERGADAAQLLAWYWWSSQQGWIDLPVGYAINRIRRGEIPPVTHTSLARFWLGLDSSGRSDFRAVFWQGNASWHLQQEYDLGAEIAQLAVSLQSLEVFNDR